MRKTLMAAAGFAVLAAAPSIAAAQDSYCERANSNNRVAGTVIGGVAGALLGSAIAGNSSNTAGTVVGGVAGAVAGNQIAKSRNQPCPEGYTERYGTYNNGAYNPAPVADPYAYREYGPAYGNTAYDANRFWQGAPNAPEQRINFLIDRVNQGRADGSLTRREAQRVMARIGDVQRELNRLRRMDRGQLSGRNQNYIQTRLDEVSRQIYWQRTNYNRR